MGEALRRRAMVDGSGFGFADPGQGVQEAVELVHGEQRGIDVELAGEDRQGQGPVRRLVGSVGSVGVAAGSVGELADGWDFGSGVPSCADRTWSR